MQLDGLKVAVLVTDGYEPSELTEPMKALREAGATATIVSNKGGTITGKTDADTAQVDMTLDEARPEDFGGLLLPGGVKNPDIMRQDERGVRFVRHFFDAGKPIAAICHAPWMLIEADVVRGRRVTSYPSLRTDLRNAGAEWVDEEVVVDQGLVTSRTPKDLPAFNAKMIEEFGEGTHERAPATEAGATTR
ncbi:MAG TPA: type 1 glutamine amidotransferase domain-containing protein [Candidatus Limnocylindrales bacterium]|jgi:protease I|nr:type 1 glutamine amidotransferase domain-containing protein [Candidatus Limnocylindrales bacterium]